MGKKCLLIPTRLQQRHAIPAAPLNGRGQCGRHDQDCVRNYLEGFIVHLPVYKLIDDCER